MVTDRCSTLGLLFVLAIDYEEALPRLVRKERSTGRMNSLIVCIDHIRTVPRYLTIDLVAEFNSTDAIYGIFVCRYSFRYVCST